TIEHRLELLATVRLLLISHEDNIVGQKRIELVERPLVVRVDQPLHEGTHLHLHDDLHWYKVRRWSVAGKSPRVKLDQAQRSGAVKQTLIGCDGRSPGTARNRPGWDRARARPRSGPAVPTRGAPRTGSESPGRRDERLPGPRPGRPPPVRTA